MYFLFFQGVDGAATYNVQFHQVDEYFDLAVAFPAISVSGR